MDLISLWSCPALVLLFPRCFFLICGFSFSRRRRKGLSNLLPSRLLSPFYSSGHFFANQIPLLIGGFAQRVIISVSQVEGSITATVLFPESHPPVSPGLIWNTPLFLLTSALCVCP
jgi:hypothetical protein